MTRETSAIGITFWDTANTYQAGTSEELVGRAISRYARCHPVVCAPIVGATRPHHLTEAVAALDLHLTSDETESLEQPYAPHGPSWF